MSRRLISLAVALVLGATMSAGVVAQPVAVKVPGGRPAKGWTKPVIVSLDQAHRETSIVLSPKDPDLLFVCTPSGVPNTQHNQSYFHISRDGGESWVPADIEGPRESDARNFTFEGGDCDVAFDQEGTMYTADTWLGSLSVGHSTDEDETWSGTPIAGTTPVVDRPWLVGGPGGTVHVSYQDLQCCMPSAIWYTRSEDYGQTFLPAVPVTTAGQGGAFTWEGNLVVSPEGEDLHLVYTRREDVLNNRNAPQSVWVASSNDAGLTWTSTLVAQRPHSASFLYPSMDMDDAGYLHVVFASPDEKDVPIWYSVSKDGAQTWSKPIPLSRGDTGYSPWIAAGKKGEAAVVWYGSTDAKADTTTKSPWYFYWARITAGHAKSPKIRSGTTTEKPMFVGTSLIPEFEMVRLDEDGRMHIGMSAFYKASEAAPTQWAIYYQREKL